MRHAYRLPWVIVMLDVLSQGTTALARLMFHSTHLARRAARHLTRPPDEAMTSMICQRIRQAKQP